MTVPIAKVFPVGARYAAVFALNAAGIPDAQDTTAYKGVEFNSPKAFTLTVPEPRRINHVGADRVLVVDALPPLEAASGELTVPSDYHDMDALLTGVLSATVGESKLLANMTDKQGSEPTVGLVLYQQAVDANGLRRWRSFIIPKARCIPMPAGMAEETEDTKYSISMFTTQAHLWGKALEQSVDGAVEMQFVRGISEYKPKVVAWKSDGTEVTFTFPTAKQAATTDKISVWVNGTVATGTTVAVTGVTFDTAPADGAIIVAFYEHA